MSNRHGLRTPNQGIFHQNLKLFGLGQTFWADKFWVICDILGGFTSTHFGTVKHLSMFSINQPLPLQKLRVYIKCVYIKIPNIYMELGFEFQFEFEFGPQRIRTLAIMCA